MENEDELPPPEEVSGRQTNRTFSLDRWGRIEAKSPDGSFIDDQSVKALLLFEILHELKAIREALERQRP